MNISIPSTKYKKFAQCARCRRDAIRHFFNGEVLILSIDGTDNTVCFTAEYCTQILSTHGKLKEYNGPVYRPAN